MPQKNSDILQQISKRFLEAIDNIMHEPKVYKIYTIRELTAKVGLSPNAIYKMRGGSVNVTVEQIYNLAHNFNLSTDSIILGTNKPKSKSFEDRLSAIERKIKGSTENSTHPSPKRVKTKS